MTLREGFAQTDRVPSYGSRGFGQIVTYVLYWLKKLNLEYMWGKGVGCKNHMGGRGRLKTSEYRHMGRGYKIAQKTVI